MKLKTLGATERSVPSIWMGTWQAGKTGFRGKTQWVGVDDAEIAAAFEVAIEQGMVAFDTALIYGEGESEKKLGQFIQGKREQVFVASKMHPLQHRYDQVLNACHRSLTSLKTDYLDLYQIHFPSGFLKGKVVPIEETMKALSQLKKEGKIRAIGVSNFSKDQLEEAMEYDVIDTVQPPYSLVWRQAEKELIPFCCDNQITVLAYSPIAQGLLSGRFTSAKELDPEDNRVRNQLFHGDHLERVTALIDKLKPLAESRQMTLAQLALTWVCAQESCVAIAGARNPEQARLNALAGNYELSPEDELQMRQWSEEVCSMLPENPMMWTAS